MGRLGTKTTVELDGTTYTMAFDLNAMVQFEEATGKSLINRAEGDEFSAKELRALLWACLAGDSPSLTLEEVGMMITPYNMAEVSGKISEMMQANLPEGGGGAPKPKKPGGTKSGQ